MSRHPPVKRKEIIYKRSYIDNGINDFNNRIDHEFASVKKPQKPGVVYQNNIYYPDKLDEVDHKVDAILHALTVSRHPQEFKPAPKLPTYENELDRMRDIVDRLEKIDLTKRKNSNSLPILDPQDDVDFGDIRKKIDDLSNKQRRLSENVKRATNRSSEHVDDILTVVNDTRCDLEEKIDTVRHFGEQQCNQLDDKIGSLQDQQDQIQIQMNELMLLLTSMSTSRASSRIEKPIDTGSSASVQRIVEIPISSKASSDKSVKSSLINNVVVYQPVKAPVPKPPRQIYSLKKTQELDETSVKSLTQKRLSVSTQKSETVVVKKIQSSKSSVVSDLEKQSSRAHSRNSQRSALDVVNVRSASRSSTLKTPVPEDRISIGSRKVSDVVVVAKSPELLQQKPPSSRSSRASIPEHIRAKRGVGLNQENIPSRAQSRSSRVSVVEKEYVRPESKTSTNKSSRSDRNSQKSGSVGITLTKSTEFASRKASETQIPEMITSKRLSEVPELQKTQELAPRNPSEIEVPSREPSEIQELQKTQELPSRKPSEVQVTEKITSRKPSEIEKLQKTEELSSRKSSETAATEKISSRKPSEVSELQKTQELPSRKPSEVNVVSKSPEVTTSRESSPTSPKVKNSARSSAVLLKQSEGIPLVHSEQSSVVSTRREVPVDVPASFERKSPEHLKREIELNSVRGSIHKTPVTREPSRISADTDIDKYFAPEVVEKINENRVRSPESYIEEKDLHISPFELVKSQSPVAQGAAKTKSPAENKKEEKLWTMVIECYDPHWHSLSLELMNKNGQIEKKIVREGTSISSEDMIPALTVVTRRESQPALFQSRV